MTGELTVDTGLLRAAADGIEDVSRLFGSVGGRQEGCPLSDHSLGNSAVAREVVASAGRRVLQARQVAAALADASALSAEQIRVAAAAFERLEASIVPRPR